MPLPLEVLAWTAAAFLALMTLLGVAFLAALIVAALEVRSLARAIGREVAWFAERRRQVWYRARFAQKWLKHMSRRLIS